MSSDAMTWRLLHSGDERARTRDAWVISAKEAQSGTDLPSVTVVLLAFDRREHVRLTLTKTLGELDYAKDRLEVIVVDNASTDGTAEMLKRDFPAVRVIRRSWNCGVSAWNDGFAVATGDYVLALDDDCYLPHDGLRRAVSEAEDQRADLVSFGVRSLMEEGYRFDIDQCVTGLFSFWGCAVLVRREVLSSLGGYDPEIFVWGNELEFMLRFFDHGFRHLHLPEVVAVHATSPRFRPGQISEGAYRISAHNLAYIAAKLLRRRDAAEALLALLVHNLGAGLGIDRAALKALADTVRGFAHGLRHRRPVRPGVSRTYRRNFESFASPWWISPPLGFSVRGLLVHSPAEDGYRGRRDQWLAERARFYPRQRGVLEI
jgi:GT2 family glycosyltransferase